MKRDVLVFLGRLRGVDQSQATAHPEMNHQGVLSTCAGLLGWPGVDQQILRAPPKPGDLLTRQPLQGSSIERLSQSR